MNSLNTYKKKISFYKIVLFCFTAMLLFMATYSILGEKFLPSDNLKGTMRFNTFEGKWMWMSDEGVQKEVTFPVQLDVKRGGR